MVHTVARGETLSRIAQRYGLSWREIYNAPQNAAFRARRPNPNMIKPGDTLFVPQGGGGDASEDPSSSGDDDGGVCSVEDDALSGDPEANSQGQDQNTPSTASGSTTSLATEKEPDVVTAQMVRDGIFASGQKMVGFAAWLAKVLQRNRNAVDRIFGHMSATADGAVAGAALYTSYRHFQKGERREGLAELLLALGKLWKVLPASVRGSLIDPLSTLIARIPKLAPVAHALPPLDKIDGLAAMLMLLGALVKGDAAYAKMAAQDLIESMRAHPGDAIALAGPLSEFFLGLIPNRTRAKLMARMGGRKVPVLGTIVVGITDVIQIWSKPTSWTSWAGLGSTLAGLIPAAGTALSILIDLGIIIGTIIENIQDLDFDDAEDPAGSVAVAI